MVTTLTLTHWLVVCAMLSRQCLADCQRTGVRPCISRNRSLDTACRCGVSPASSTQQNVHIEYSPTRHSYYLRQLPSNEQDGERKVGNVTLNTSSQGDEVSLSVALFSTDPVSRYVISLVAHDSSSQRLGFKDFFIVQLQSPSTEQVWLNVSCECPANSGCSSSAQCPPFRQSPSHQMAVLDVTLTALHNPDDPCHFTQSTHTVVVPPNGPSVLNNIIRAIYNQAVTSAQGGTFILQPSSSVSFIRCATWGKVTDRPQPLCQACGQAEINLGKIIVPQPEFQCKLYFLYIQFTTKDSTLRSQGGDRHMFVFYTFPRLGENSVQWKTSSLTDVSTTAGVKPRSHSLVSTLISHPACETSTENGIFSNASKGNGTFTKSVTSHSPSFIREQSSQKDQHHIQSSHSPGSNDSSPHDTGTDTTLWETVGIGAGVGLLVLVVIGLVVRACCKRQPKHHSHHQINGTCHSGSLQSAAGQSSETNGHVVLLYCADDSCHVNRVASFRQRLCERLRKEVRMHDISISDPGALQQCFHDRIPVLIVLSREVRDLMSDESRHLATWEHFIHRENGEVLSPSFSVWFPDDNLSEDDVSYFHASFSPQSVFEIRDGQCDGLDSLIQELNKCNPMTEFSASIQMCSDRDSRNVQIILENEDSTTVYYGRV